MSEITSQPAPGSSNIPDSRGINFFTSDPDFARLLELHLGDELYQELECQLIALGQRVSDELDVWALSADKNPPQLCGIARGAAKRCKASTNIPITSRWSVSPTRNWVWRR